MQLNRIRHKKPSFLFFSAFFSIILFNLSPVFAEEGQPTLGSAAKSESTSITALREMGKAFATISEKASPAVVGVRVEKVITQQYLTIPNWPFGDQFDPFGDDLFNRFFQRQNPRGQRGQRGQRSPQERKIIQPAQASGFIISADGYIVTNNHLVGDADKVFVKIGESSEIKADVIGTDEDTDVAVIKIKKTDLPYLELADSDKIEVGEWVLAIGNPFGLSHTVTAGIVSAKGRNAMGINKYEDFIQTDAAINPGNSGGPLINLDGKVIGINTAIIGPSGGNIGIGFAIPINIVKNVYKDLITKGKVVRGYLGVSVQDLTPEMTKTLKLDQTKGAIVPSIEPNSPAEKAGIKQGDIIVEFEGKGIENRHDLINLVTSLKPGTEVKLVVLRDGSKKTLNATLGELKEKEQAGEGESRQNALETLGLSVQNLNSNLAEQLGYEGLSGVVVTNVESGSEAERAGISTGMLIMEVNQQKVKNAAAFEKEIKQVKKGDSVLLLIKNRDNMTGYFVLQIPED